VTERSGIAAYASAGGRASGRARQRLDLARVERELPPMDSAEHVKARLELLCNWTAAGLLAGSKAGAAVRSCEAWLKLHEHELDRQRMKVLEQRVKELEAELSGRALRRVP